MPPTILVQLPDREEAESAGESALGRIAGHALDRAGREGGVVHALAVVDTGRYGEPALSSAEVFVDGCEDDAHRRLAAFAARATARGVEVEAHCCHGNPNERLVEYAREVGADVVVLDRRLPHAVRERLREADIAIERPGRTEPVPA